MVPENQLPAIQFRVDFLLSPKTNMTMETNNPLKMYLLLKDSYVSIVMLVLGV